MPLFLRQSTASQEVLLGPFLDSTDGVTAETGLTIANTDIQVWKTGGTTEGNKNSGGATHIAGGRYYAVLDATDTNTIGPMRLSVQVAGALAVWLDCCVLDEAVYDVLFGTTAPSTHTAAATAALVAAGAVASVTGAVGSVTGNVGGNVTGSVGSVVGAVGSVTARVTANTDQLAGQTVTAAAGVTFPTSVASPTNITAGTITTATNVTNLPSIPNNWLTAAGIAAGALTAAVWDTSTTGHTTGGTFGGSLNAAGSAGDPWGTALPGAYTAGSAGHIIGNRLDAAITSRLAPTTAGRTLDVTATGAAGIDWGNVENPTTANNLSATNIDTDQVVASVTGNVNAVLIDGAHGGTAATITFERLIGVSTTAGEPCVLFKGDSLAGGAGLRCQGGSGAGSGNGAEFTGGASGGADFALLNNDADSVRTVVWNSASARLLTAGTNIVLAKGVGVTGFTDIDAAGVRTAVGLASANLDTQLAALDTLLDSILDDTGTSGVALSAAVCNKIADHVRRRTQANVEASSDGDALSVGSAYGFIQMAQESAVSGTTLTVKKTDGSTTLGTKTLTATAGADPVTGIS